MERTTRRGRRILIAAAITLLLALLSIVGWRLASTWLAARRLNEVQVYERSREIALAREELKALLSLEKKAGRGLSAGSEEGIAFLLDEGVLNRCLSCFVGLCGETRRGDRYRILDARIHCRNGLGMASFELEGESRYRGIAGRGRADALLTLVPRRGGGMVGRFRLISVVPDIRVFGRKTPPLSFIRRLSSTLSDRQARLRIPDLVMPLSLEGEIPLGERVKRNDRTATTVTLPARRLVYRVDLEDAGFYAGFVRGAAAGLKLVTAPEGSDRPAEPREESSPDRSPETRPLTIEPAALDPSEYEKEMARLERRLVAARKRVARLTLPSPPARDVEVRCSRRFLGRLFAELAAAWKDDLHITIDGWDNAWEKEQKHIGQVQADIVRAEAVLDLRRLQLLEIRPGALRVRAVISGQGSGEVRVRALGSAILVPVALEAAADRELVFTMEGDENAGVVLRPMPAAIPIRVAAEVRVAGMAIRLRPELSLRAEKVIRPVRLPLGLTRTFSVPVEMKGSRILRTREVRVDVRGGEPPEVAPGGTLVVGADIHLVEGGGA